MSKVKIKNLPRLTLNDLLKRRKMTLDDFIKESGVQTYEALLFKSHRLGCQPPTEAEFKELRPVVVNSPSDGVVVINPPDENELKPMTPRKVKKAKVIEKDDDADKKNERVENFSSPLLKERSTKLDS